MWDVLSALAPPAVVATVFCVFIYKLLRKEMAPRTSDGRLAQDIDNTSKKDGASTEGDRNTSDAAANAASASEAPSTGTDAQNR